MLQKKPHGASTVGTNAELLIKLRMHQSSCFGGCCFEPDVADVVLSGQCVELSLSAWDEFVACSGCLPDPGSR